MKRRRRLLIALAGVLAIALAWLATFVVLPPSPITGANFARIKPGMTESEVEVIFGLPAGDYASGPLVPLASLFTTDRDTVPEAELSAELDMYRVTGKAAWDPDFGRVVKEWAGDEGVALIVFHEGKVSGQQFVA